MISPDLLAIVCCPDCSGRLDADSGALVCESCARRYAVRDGYLDLRPATAFAEQTKYLDEALHADARHETVSPPLLQAGVRQWMLRELLRPAAGDLVIDLGCGSGRSLVWNRSSGATLVGIDVAPYFAAEALEHANLVLGDLRRLPFRAQAFSKGYTLDVFEHLTRETLEDVLAEIARVMRPGGRVFVYSHVRRNSRLAGGLRTINRMAAGLERVGLIDLGQERLRKSDHVNPLTDIPDLEQTTGRAGFRIACLRYYTPLIGAFVENILMRVAERALGRWRSRRALGNSAVAKSESRPAAQARLARVTAKRRLAGRGPLYYALKGTTWLMMLDVWLLGRVRSGPFFALLERVPAASGDERTLAPNGGT
jgi:SAM-dependent methyltransferase